jgi:hypothetical protein
MGNTKAPGTDYNVGEALWGAPFFGKPPMSRSKEAHEALMEAMGMSSALWKDTKGMRGNITNQLTDFTAGNYDVTSNPMFAPGKAATEDIYTRSRENIMETMPAGGTMETQLSGLEQARARGLTDVIGEIQQDMYNKAYGASYGTPQTSIAGANQSASTMQQAISAQSAAASQNAQGMGQLIGTLMSSKSGGKK